MADVAGGLVEGHAGHLVPKVMCTSTPSARRRSCTSPSGWRSNRELRLRVVQIQQVMPTHPGPVQHVG